MDDGQDDHGLRAGAGAGVVVRRINTLRMYEEPWKKTPGSTVDPSNSSRVLSMHDAPARANTRLSFSSISFHLSHRASRVLAHTRAATAADNRSVPRRVIAAQGDRSVERLKEGCELKLLPGAQSLLKSTRLARCSPGTQMIQQHSHTATMMPPPVWLSLFRPQL